MSACAFCGSGLTVRRVTLDVCTNHREVERILRILGVDRRSTITLVLRAKIWERDDAACRYCGKQLKKFGTGPDDAVIEHVIPRGTTHRRRLGTDDIDNLVLACGKCNRRKRNRVPERAGMVLRPRPDSNRVATSDLAGVGESAPIRATAAGVAV